MEYGPLGRTGLLVSRLAVGTMTFGEGDTPLQRLNQTDAFGVVGESLEAGVNFFNTAATYGGGRSEEMLGVALGAQRHDVVIATKVAGPTGPAIVHRGLSRRHVLEALEGSLRRMNTDYVDVYLAHHFDPVTPLEETLDVFDTVVRQGKARYIGFSNWPAWVAAKAMGLQAQRGWHSFCASESYYSLVGRDLEHELVPFCEDAGVGIVVWSPLAMGFLTGRYGRGNMAEAGRFTSYDVVPALDLDAAHATLEVVRKVAEANGVSPAQVSLAWLLSKSHVASVLVGASSVAQLRENLGAAALVLSNDEVAELDRVSAPTPVYPRWLRDKLAARSRR